MLHNIRLIVPVLQQLVYSVLWHQSNLFPTSSAIWPQSSPKNWRVSMTSTDFDHPNWLAAKLSIKRQLRMLQRHSTCQMDFSIPELTPFSSQGSTATNHLGDYRIIRRFTDVTCQIYNFLGICCFLLPTFSVSFWAVLQRIMKNYREIRISELWFNEPHIYCISYSMLRKQQVRVKSSEYSVIAVFRNRIANAASFGHVGSMV